MRRRILIIAAAVLSLSACVKHDEIEFSGKVVDVRYCQNPLFDSNPGYIVKLDYPDSIGGTISTAEGTSSNLIVLYEPDVWVRVNDHITGTFYINNNYSKANCSLRYDDFELPEGVILSVKVDK